MILINAWFFLTNVIYINTNRHYIFIEKSCWNTMVHLIWKRRKPKLDELQHFKNICYDVYLEFSISGKVNHNLFNNSIKQYQLQQFNFDEYTTTTVQEQKDVVINNETNHIQEDYLNESSKPDLTNKQLNHVLKLSNRLNDFEEDIKLFINHQKSTSVFFDALMDVVGFGRILTIFKILLQSGSIKLHNIYEFRVVELAFHYGLHKSIIDATNYADCDGCNKWCDMHIRYFNLCEDCLMVNQHKRIDKNKDIPLDERICKKYTWFGKQGIIVANQYNKLNYNNISIGEHLITKTTNIDYFNVLHNIYSEQQKKKQVENDVVLNAMIKKQCEDRKFSGLQLNDEIMDRKNSLLKYNKKSEVFTEQPKFSSVSPTKTLTDEVLSDSKYVETLPSPLFTNDNNKSITFEAGDTCPDCDSIFERRFGSIKCSCRTISKSFSGSKFSFITK